MKIEQIAEQPWEYTLYLVNETNFVLSVPYEPRSGVGADLTILLTEEEVLKYKEEDTWLDIFSKNIRSNFRDYFERAKVTKESGYLI